MLADLGVLVTVGLAVVGAIVEVVRLEGRLNSHDTLFIEREKLVYAQHNELKDRLERIEKKLDESLKLNGSGAH